MAGSSSTETPEQKKKHSLALQAQCTSFLNGHYREKPQDTLFAAARYCAEHDLRADRYGEGDFLEAFEAEIAGQLGFAAAVFMPSGTMAQLIAMRIWHDEQGKKPIGLHATSHLELHEEHAYTKLHGMKAVILGRSDRMLTADDLAKQAEGLSAALVELPARELGGILPSWQDLSEMKRLSKAKGFKLHLDGARLWECGPAYEMPLAQICEGFDSAYVSFYKGLNGVSGCMLAGSKHVIAKAKVWQRRHGGNLFALYPYIVSAKMNYEKRRDAFPKYLTRAREIAALFGTIDGLKVVPEQPHTNMFHLFIRADVAAIEAVRDQIALRDKFWLSAGFSSAQEPGWSKVEIYIGDCALDVKDQDLRRAFTDFLQKT